MRHIRTDLRKDRNGNAAVDPRYCAEQGDLPLIPLKEAVNDLVYLLDTTVNVRDRSFCSGVILKPWTASTTSEAFFFREPRSKGRHCSGSAVSGELAKDTDVLDGDVTARNKTHAEQIVDPFGIREAHMDVPLKDIPDGDPILAGALHILMVMRNDAIACDDRSDEKGLVNIDATQKYKSILQFLLRGLKRPSYLCLNGDAYTDFYTALATDELRATPPTVLCSLPLSSLLYRKTDNFAASVFIPVCAGAAPAW